jgi:N-acetylglucosaminyldiphosphoundecaprenol N-acetyl-beta-D-mannosaminyltransferase
MIYKIFGVRFHNINFNQFSKMRYKGLVVLPSGPGLSTIYSDKIYHKSLQNADIALFDSGYFVFLLRIFKGLKVSKFSGYKFLKLFLSYSKNKKFFSIEVDRRSAIINRKYLKKLNIDIKNKQYIAPFYKRNSCILDINLLKILKITRPKIILINLGGGTQEVLGSYIKNNLKYKPLIICTGAAISYFTKQQAPVNNFFDNLYLGWLIRCIFNPYVFIPRYLSSFKLIFHVLRLKIKKKS